MEEIGANTNVIKEFINILKNNGIEKALEYNEIPLEAKNFIAETFKIINTKKPHLIASSFTFSRETVIPDMFLKILNNLQIEKEKIPTLIYYLERHIFFR